MNDSAIINLLSNLDEERQRRYRELLDFYQGHQWPGRERWGEKRLTFNYARIFVDKMTSYLMSGMGFTVDAVEDTAEARARAEQAEKALYRVYETNGLEQLDFETETDCAILGDGCYKITWDHGTKNIRVTAPDIQGIYAWWEGDDISRVWRVASKYQLSEEEVERLYEKSEVRRQNSESFLSPLLTSDSRLLTPPSKLHTLIEVWTDRDFELYLDGNLLEKKLNPYGFIPFVIFPDTMRQNL